MTFTIVSVATIRFFIPNRKLTILGYLSTEFPVPKFILCEKYDDFVKFSVIFKGRTDLFNSCM